MALKVQRYAPCQGLKPYVDCFMVIETDEPVTNKILPDGVLTVGFRFKGQTSTGLWQPQQLPAFTLSGISTTRRVISYNAHTGTLLVRFKAGRAGAFFNIPLNQLKGLSVGLDNVFDKYAIEAIEDKLGLEVTNPGRIAVVERFLMKQLRPVVTDASVSAAVGAIESNRGNIKISQLASHLCVNINSLEKNFRSRVGVSPKTYASILRLKNLISSYNANTDMTQALYSAGFFDQSHFIKSFKAFTGESPQAFFKGGAYW